MVSTRVTALSLPASAVGTPAAARIPGIGTATTSCGPDPEAGATGTTSPLNSNTTRVPEGDGQVRRPVSCTAPVACVAGVDDWAHTGGATAPRASADPTPPPRITPTAPRL